MRKPKETPKENKVTVRVKKVYLDLRFSKMMDFGEEFEVDRERAAYLYNLGLVEILE